MHFKLLSMHDWCIKVIHNKMTALLKYFKTFNCFPEAYVNFDWPLYSF